MADNLPYRCPLLDIRLDVTFFYPTLWTRVQGAAHSRWLWNVMNRANTGLSRRPAATYIGFPVTFPTLMTVAPFRTSPYAPTPDGGDRRRLYGSGSVRPIPRFTYGLRLLRPTRRCGTFPSPGGRAYRVTTTSPLHSWLRTSAAEHRYRHRRLHGAGCHFRQRATGDRHCPVGPTDVGFGATREGLQCGRSPSPREDWTGGDHGLRVPFHQAVAFGFGTLPPAN